MARILFPATEWFSPQLIAALGLDLHHTLQGRERARERRGASKSPVFWHYENRDLLLTDIIIPVIGIHARLSSIGWRSPVWQFDHPINAQREGEQNDKG